MSAFSALMLRLGWIKLSRYGLEVGIDGQVHPVSGGSFAPLLVETMAPPIVAQVVAQPVAMPPSLPQLTAAEEEQNAWQASMAKAKLQSYTELGILPVVEEDEDEDEENWAALIAAANDRASQKESSTGKDESQLEPELAQKPARSTSEDGSSTVETAMLEVAAASPSEEEEWAALRRNAEAKQEVEARRMKRGVREVQRLRRQSSTTGSPPPRVPRAAPIRKPPSVPLPVRAETTEELTEVGPSPVEVDVGSVGDSTQVDVPRIGQG